MAFLLCSLYLSVEDGTSSVMVASAISEAPHPISTKLLTLGCLEVCMEEDVTVAFEISFVPRWVQNKKLSMTS